MKPTDFAEYLTAFLTNWLTKQRNASPKTIHSYRDTFKLLLKYYQEREDMSPERITMSTLTVDVIKDFLSWLETERKCSISTRNQRLAAIHSFFRYVQAEDPARLYHFQKVIAIPMKKAGKPMVEHLTPEAMKLLLDQPDRNLPQGRRDLTLMSVLYDTGARVQELIDAKVEDVFLLPPPVIVLTGKGNKIRRVPLMKNTAFLLQNYLAENHLNSQHKRQYPLFTNRQHYPLTKEGVAYIIGKYVNAARSQSSIIPQKVKPHMFRHSKAMHLLQAGVNLIYIRDFLGHVDVKTTEIYAQADTETKRKAIENAYPDLVESKLPDWSKDQALLSWLSELR
ncbi:Tyrosine recombinase XerD [Sporomusa silvacetica DSM 10669]|uniref:Tyrosine recombinase XerD n=1 Tax=Sporomusa silvacetica DSM 10669 TaxID=1123289 RepID=A0ABZ3IVB7_9FIRM|nr:site-specific integrase [Sporomusa silvacetica]OZC13062.1 tyrosine recombinase XerD [Sporomusa silvacetica DSM 10669]